ncbi:MAG: ABC transporter ATP-binding protein [Syntrophales bacterium]|jgi:peptide/nickel transport system ATP-binding protein|nr:ABC transporter ATP-binding protein [Syntrophales bacterium]
MVNLENLSVIYREGDHALLAIDRATLSLKAGRVTALVGESGSGKTTIGNALMGLLPQNASVEGSIRFHDTELTSLDEESYRQIRWQKAAMVFQNGAAGLNPVQRIVEQVAEPLIYHRNMKREEAVEIAGERLACLGLFSETINRYPHELSGGQVQRALFAMALVLDPEVLILDEPTSAMDAALKGFIGGMISDLKEKGAAILLISHDLELAAKTADEAALLYLGQIMEILPARDLLLQPFHPYTRALGRSFPAMDATRDLGGMRGDAFYRYTHVHRLKEGAMQPHIHIATGGDKEEGGHAPASGCLFRSRCTQAVDACHNSHVHLAPVGAHQVRCLRGGIVYLMKFDKITKSYGTLTALESADLTIHAGEILSIVGETGSGKTTLAMIAAGALAPDSGKREFAGRDMDQWIREDRLSFSSHIGIIYQSPAESVSHRFTAFDIVAEPLRIQKNNHHHTHAPAPDTQTVVHAHPFAAAHPPASDDSGDAHEQELCRRVLAAMAEAHLPVEPDFLKRHPHELNMGTIQRLCIARALVHEPTLVIADEPTSALDPSVQAKVMKMLLNLQTEKGLTMIFVTHDIALARKISDRICVMLSGRIVEIGPAAKVVGNPGHPYTRGLIESARGGKLMKQAGARNATAGGCPFADRCDRQTDICRRAFPTSVELSGGSHFVWCFNP